MVKEKDFIAEHNGKQTRLITLTNQHGMQVQITNYGARIVSILVPDKTGALIDVNIGHSSIQQYLSEKDNYYGTVVGRVCGRIRDARFTIDEQTYELTPNNGANFLHGGENGFHTQVFEIVEQTNERVTLNYKAKDGEEGFPGNLDLTLTYTLAGDNSIDLSFEAVSDKKTPLNLTHHAFFNLNGEGSGTVLKHQLQIFTDTYLPIKDDVLPTGELAKVKDIVFDFTQLKPIGEAIDQPDQQLIYGKGYDHTFVLDTKFKPGKIKKAAYAIGDQTGISLTVFTDQPGIHLYTGNFMEGQFELKSGAKDECRTAFCLETQHLADALNQPQFPSIILQPQEVFKTQTKFKFAVEK